MKIALFTESYTPYISGVSRSVELAKKGLETLGHEIFVFAPDYPGYKDPDKHVFRFPSLPTKYPGFRVAVPAPLLIPKEKFDIIHSNSPFGLGLLAKQFSKKSGVPYIYSFHTLFTDYLSYVPLPKPLSKSLLLSYMKRFCKSCNKIIVPNQTTLEYTKSLGISGDFEIIPSGVDVELAEKADGKGLREKFGIPAQAKVFLYVGRLSKEKNLPFLLSAFKKISKKCPAAFLALAAGGPEEQNLKDFACETGIAERTVFAGQIKYPDILNYYKFADIFLYASKTETQGLVIAEAKACGLPVIAVDGGGIKESITDGEDGFLVSEDLELFCDKAVILCNDNTLWSVMADKAKKNAANDFSCSNVAKKLESVYNSLLNTI
ncbi:MAG: glycosyltransferase [Candidatus Margulisiibacteriota bacterium]